MSQSIWRLQNLRATTYCQGKRVDLTWLPPENGSPRYLRIVRSEYSYPLRDGDQGDVLYDGAFILGYTDGLDGPGSQNEVSNTALKERRFYYYTLFTRDSVSDPWLTNDVSMVCGLSIADYSAREGRYVYKLLPSNVRAEDASEKGGRQPYLLRDYCDVLQCAVNVYRGWAEGLLYLRDPERAPAGKIGVASDQTVILEAMVDDLDFEAEKSFDNGVLRRLAFGMMDVYRRKGTCPGLVLFALIFARWQVRCDDAVDPNCGVGSMFSTWDGDAYKLQVAESLNGDFSGTGVAYTADAEAYVDLPVSAVTNALGDAPADLPDSQVNPSLTFIIDAMGTWCCVKRVEHIDETTRRVVLEKGFLRRHINVQGFSGLGTFTIETADLETAPWQYAAPAGTEALRWGSNAWAGYKLKTESGIYNVLGSEATDNAGETVLYLDDDPTGTEGVLAKDFDGNEDPVLHFTGYVGLHTLIVSPRWDYRLAGAIDPGPFNALLAVLSGQGVVNVLLSPGDVTLVVKGIGPGEPTELVGTVTGVAGNTLTDTTQAWAADQWEGYYLLPNWSQSRVTRVVSNTADTLTVSFPEGLASVTKEGLVYALLTEENALKYVRLIQLCQQLVFDGTRVFVKFET